MTAFCMNNWLIIGILTVYILVLFACAFFGEKYAKTLSPKRHMLLLSLALGVYCSSWTFFGATGTAVRQGINYLPIYLGPLLFLWLGYDIWRRIGRIRQHHSISSIADFIAARYGKSGMLAALVTILSVIGTIPYLALQLRAIALSTLVILPDDSALHLSLTTNTVLVLTGILALLAMLFGTRQAESTEQHGGLMLAVALESFVKLVALIAVALFFVFDQPHNIVQITQDIKQQLQEVQKFGVPDTFWIQTLLAGLAIICLPRQFHIAVVELREERHIKGTRRWFSLYLLLTALAIIPIASWALHSNASILPIPDVAVLSLPITYQHEWLTLLSFLGGFSASTGMLLVASVALSIMLSNDLIMPALWKLNLLSRHDQRLPFVLKIVRRLCILMVMSLGFLFFHFFDGIDRLSVFGLIAFSAVAQFAPALIGGLYWRGGSRQGVYAGLFIGFVMWAYTLILPMVIHSLPPHYAQAGQNLLYHGLFNISALRPEALLGLESLAPLSHGVLWSLGLNTLAYFWVSKLYRPSVAEQIQAESFFYYDTPRSSQNIMADMGYFQSDSPKLKIGDLIALATRITGEQATQRAFDHFCEENYLTLYPNRVANSMWLRFTEQYLAGTIGAASARTLLKTALVNNGIGIAQVANILDQASQWQRFNQNSLMTMIDHMTQGVSVVDANMCLVAWNSQYLKLFDYPKDLVYVGCPIADLTRYNAERGDYGPGAVEEHVARRIRWMQVGNKQEFERIRKDGRVIQMQGNPIEGGGFVTTFVDITSFRENEAVLEAHVSERTQQLATALKEQKQAREQADQANMSKSRFIAAASHDLLQPMHAARLFSTALEQGIENEEDKKTLEQLDRALHGAESMLSALLDIARLEGGTIQPKRMSYPLHDLLSDLALQFKSIAAQRSIQFKVHDATFWIDTDPQWIRRIIQNFVSNALRYTAQGKIVVGTLRSAQKPQHIRIGIWDTGPGIDEEQKAKLFQEFERCGHTSPWGEQGLGLGLAIVKRMTHLLDYPVNVYSTKHKGSCFMIEVPIVEAPKVPKTTPQPVMMQQTQYNVLCLDNDETILEGMTTLLTKWGYKVFKAREPEDAKQIIDREKIQIWMIDQHLNLEKRGLDFIEKYRSAHIPVALITADSDPDLPQKLKGMNVMLLRKPLKPASMRAWLSGLKI